MKIFSKLRFIKELVTHRSLIRKLPTLYRMIKMWRKGQYKTSSMDIILPLLGVAYVLSPIDLIPNIAVPFVGMADDIAILSLVLPKLSKEIDKFLIWEAEKKLKTTNSLTTM